MEVPILDKDIEISKPTPKKKSLFSKPTWGSRDAQNSPQGLEFFSRAKELFPMRVEEQDRRRQEKKIREERARSSASIDKEEMSPRDSKRRRITPQKGEDKSYSSGSSGEQSLPRSSREFSDQSSASPPKPQELSTSLTQRYLDEVRKPYPIQKVEKGYISLSDGSDSPSDDDSFAVKRNPVPVDDLDFAIVGSARKLQPIVDDEEDQFSEEEFPELVAKARERAREKAQKAADTKNRDANIEDDIFDTMVQVDPIVEFFVTSRIMDSKPLRVKRKFSQRLQEVRLEWCRKQSIDGHPWAPEFIDTTIFTFRGKRVWDVTTCKTMGLEIDHDGNVKGDGSDAENRVHLEAWTKDMFAEYLKKPKESGNGEDAYEEAEQQPKEKRTKLVFKSRQYEDFKLAVKESTTFQKIIEVYRKTYELPPTKNIVLSLDGEDLEPSSTVGDADLEDMNIVEVLLR